MPSSFHVEVQLPIPADVLWRLRASPPFASFLVSIGALNRMESSPARRVPGHPTLCTRTQTYVPATISIPDIVKPIFDDSVIEICDTQTWDDSSRTMEQRFEIRPSVLADLVKSHGKLVLSPASKIAVGDSLEDMEQEQGSCLHVLQGECGVGIPFLGWYVEQAIIANMQTFYGQYPGHIQRFVDMVVKRWGTGDVSSLRMAVDKMLSEEKATE